MEQDYYDEAGFLNVGYPRGMYHINGLDAQNGFDPLVRNEKILIGMGRMAKFETLNPYVGLLPTCRPTCRKLGIFVRGSQVWNIEPFYVGLHTGGYSDSV